MTPEERKRLGISKSGLWQKIRRRNWVNNYEEEQ